MPSAAESTYVEGVRMPPVKVGENFRLRRDIVTWLQNSVRDPMLQIQDMKIRLSTCLKIKERIEETAKEYSWDAVSATLRWTLEDTGAEVRRRLREWPDGTVRSVVFPDSTLRENCLIKLVLELVKRDDKLIIDFRGSSPEFKNRANNTELHALKGDAGAGFSYFRLARSAAQPGGLRPDGGAGGPRIGARLQLRSTDRAERDDFFSGVHRTAGGGA